jgi:CDGSH-type Zn-finger protein
MSPRIEVEEHGPYRVSGLSSVERTWQVETEYGEPIDWGDGPEIGVEDPCRLCRCGLSKDKPRCDDACVAAGFDGAETAHHGPSSERRQVFVGDGVVLTDEQRLCTDAGYCGDRFTKVWQMIDETADPEVRERLKRMVSLCPSGRIQYLLEEGGEPVEQDFEPAVLVQADGPFLVRGGIPVVGSDGEPYEVRNRMALCRCGQSGNKPFCDGSHKTTGFRDA